MYVYNAPETAEEEEDDDEDGVKGPCRREAIVIERPLLTQAFGLICKRGAQVCRVLFKARMNSVGEFFQGG